MKRMRGWVSRQGGGEEERRRSGETVKLVGSPVVCEGGGVSRWERWRYGRDRGDVEGETDRQRDIQRDR